MFAHRIVQRKAEQDDVGLESAKYGCWADLRLTYLLDRLSLIAIVFEVNLLRFIEGNLDFAANVQPLLRHVIACHLGHFDREVNRKLGYDVCVD